MKKAVILTLILLGAGQTVCFADLMTEVYRGPIPGCDGSNCARSVPPPEPVHAPTVFGPHALDIDFGVWRSDASRQTGPAAAGQPGDFWNTVGVAWNDDHIESNVRSTRGEWSPIQVRLINLGGGWGNSNGMGVKAPMLDSFDYPQNNQGGNSQVTLHGVPAGAYNLYLYGHGTNPVYYGNYTVIVGNHNYGHRMTSRGMDAIENTRWVEGSQYVEFAGLQVGPGDDIHIVIQPGEQVTDPSGRSFADAMICGLQLIPAEQDRRAYIEYKDTRTNELND